jgi:hypothetical protein
MTRCEQMDLADASIVVMSELHSRSQVITIERNDFSVYWRNDRQVIDLIAPPKQEIPTSRECPSVVWRKLHLCRRTQTRRPPASDGPMALTRATERCDHSLTAPILFLIARCARTANLRLGRKSSQTARGLPRHGCSTAQRSGGYDSFFAARERHQD